MPSQDAANALRRELDSPVRGHGIPVSNRRFDHVDLAEAHDRALWVAAADEAVAAGELTQRDRDIWVAVDVLAGHTFSREAAARAYGLSLSRIDQIRARTSRLVRSRASRGVCQSGGHLQFLPPARYEEALAVVAGEAALAEDPVSTAVAEKLHRERSPGLPARARRGPTATPAERAARSRRRPAVLARVRQELAGPAPAPLRLLVRLEREARSAWPEGARRARGDKPDADWLASLVPPMHSRVDVPDRRAVLTALAGYARFDTSPDPVTEARAWAAGARLWMAERDVAAVWAARRVRTLVGARHPLAVAARADEIGSLRACGYVDAAADLAQRTLATVSTIGGDADVAGLRAALLQGATTATPYWRTKTDPHAVAELTRLHAHQLMRVAEELPPDQEAFWHLTGRRRALMARHHLNVLEARAHGFRVRWPHSFQREIGALDDLAHSADDFTRRNWAMVRSRICLDVGDREGFARYFEDARQLGEQPAVARFVRDDLDAFQRMARRRTWMQ